MVGVRPRPPLRVERHLPRQNEELFQRQSAVEILLRAHEQRPRQRGPDLVLQFRGLEDDAAEADVRDVAVLCTVCIQEYLDIRRN